MSILAHMVEVLQEELALDKVSHVVQDVVEVMIPEVVLEGSILS